MLKKRTGAQRPHRFIRNFLFFHSTPATNPCPGPAIFRSVQIFRLVVVFSIFAVIIEVDVTLYVQLLISHVLVATMTRPKLVIEVFPS